MSAGGAYSYLWGPLVAMLVLLVLVLLLRWAFSRGGSLVRPSAGRPGEPFDYGLLVAVARASNHTDADLICRTLAAERIDATIGNTTQGLRVFVWPDQAEAAQRLVRSLRHDRP